MSSNGFPQSYGDIIEFDETQTLEEAIKEARYCFE